MRHGSLRTGLRSHTRRLSHRYRRLLPSYTAIRPPRPGRSDSLGTHRVGLDELLASDDAERLAAAQITTAAQLEAVGDADLQRVLGVDVATVEGWRATVVTAR